MNLSLPPHLSEPKWSELETRLTEKIGKKAVHERRFHNEENSCEP